MPSPDRRSYLFFSSLKLVSLVVMVFGTLTGRTLIHVAQPICLGSSRRVSLLKSPVRPAFRNKRKRVQPLTVAHSSMLLPDVSPEANVPPSVVKTIVEYARAMPTWEVFARAGVEIAISVFVSVLIVKAIQRATSEAVQVNVSVTFAKSAGLSGRLCKTLCASCTLVAVAVTLLCSHAGGAQHCACAV